MSPYVYYDVFDFRHPDFERRLFHWWDYLNEHSEEFTSLPNFEGADLAKIFRELEEEVLEATGGVSKDIYTYFGGDRATLLREVAQIQNGEVRESPADRSESGTATQGVGGRSEVEPEK